MTEISVRARDCRRRRHRPYTVGDTVPYGAREWTLVGVYYVTVESGGFEEYYILKPKRTDPVHERILGRGGGA